MGEVWSSGIVHLYLGLWGEHPDHGGHEVIGSGYVRLAIPPAAFTPRKGYMTNRVAFTWPNAFTPWGPMSCVMVHPEPSGDEYLLTIQLDWSPVYVSGGDALEFKPWSLRISMDDWERLSGPLANKEGPRRTPRVAWWMRLASRAPS